MGITQEIDNIFESINKNINSNKVLSEIYGYMSHNKSVDKYIFDLFSHEEILLGMGIIEMYLDLNKKYHNRI